MSTIKQQREFLADKFSDKVAILVDDTLYQQSQLSPTAGNERLFSVDHEGVKRLNSTMQRHINGNDQIYVTALFKDQNRAEIIKEFWNALIATNEFKLLPLKMQELELEQIKKIGPTSRFTIEKLFDGFLSHVDDEAKTINDNYDEYCEAAKHFEDYLVEVAVTTIKSNPELFKYVEAFKQPIAEISKLPDDKAGGDPYFVRVDKKVKGTLANSLYWSKSKQIPRFPKRRVYYTMYSRIQNKGNSIVDGIKPVTTIPSDCWLSEKNRIVQGDSRSWQFLLKPYSDLITKILPLGSPIFCGWTNQEEKNLVIGNTLKYFYGKVNFDSFDATEYDASTDPKNFALGLRIICSYVRRVCSYFNVTMSSNLSEEHIITHYLNDPTFTPWGAFFRDSTPSGHNFTGPNGTITNMLRCYVQEARRREISYQALNKILVGYHNSKIALFSCVGDDAFQLRDLDRTEDSIADENLHDGYTSNSTKILLDRNYIHYLQFAYYMDDNQFLLGYYPISRVLEHTLFQERSNQYTAESVVAQAAVQNLNNARYNPLMPFGVRFIMKGDEKYRLGYKIGVINLFKLASKGSEVAEFLGREWDPSYQGMTWAQYSEVLRPVITAIVDAGRKLGY